MAGLTAGTLAVSLILTLALEGAFALLWGVRGKRDMLLVALVNIATNPAAVTLYYFFCKYLGYGFMVIVIELCAVMFEAYMYKTRGENIKNGVLFSFLANGFSYFAGYILNRII